MKTLPHLASRRRGFTLVELVVALSAGIAVAGAAYILSKASLNAFEAEARMSQAQFSAMMALNRVTGDVQRAAFMSNPDSQKDPGGVCGNATSFASVKGIQVYRGADATSPGLAPAHAVPAVLTGNGIKPDRLRIVGNLSSSEQFEFRTVQGSTIFMTIADGPMQRTLRAMANGGPSLRSIFRPGRFVRLVDSHGKETYSRIASVQCGADATCSVTSPLPATMTITLPVPPISNGQVCGDWVSGGLINPVNIIEYWVGAPTAGTDFITTSADDAIHGLSAPGVPDPTVAQAAAQSGDANRTELVRSELSDTGVGIGYLTDPTDTTYATSEIAAEYAIDLNISATVRNAAPPFTPFQRADDDDMAPGNVAVFQLANTQAETYVGLGIRLSTRARAPDRDVAVTTNGMARFNVFKVGGVAPATPATQWARVRTFKQEVNLSNMAGIKW